MVHLLQWPFTAIFIISGEGGGMRRRSDLHLSSLGSKCCEHILRFSHSRREQMHRRTSRFFVQAVAQSRSSRWCIETQVDESLAMLHRDATAVKNRKSCFYGISHRPLYTDMIVSNYYNLIVIFLELMAIKYLIVI